nr:hypothetical protein [Candidatus Sigynarchaeota archaeon]
SIDTLKWTVIQQQYSSVTSSDGIVHLITDIDVGGPDVGRINENCLMIDIQGLHDGYVDEGHTYATHVANALCHVGNGFHSTRQFTTLGRACTLMKNTWATTEYKRIDDHTSEVNMSIPGIASSFSWTTSTYIPTCNLPINFMTRGMYYGPGTHFMAQLKSITSFELGKAMRARTYTTYDYSGEGSAPTSIDVDWVLIRKCVPDAQEPVATVEEVTSQSVEGSVAQDQTVAAGDAVISSGVQVFNANLAYPGSDLDLLILTPSGSIVDSTWRNVIVSEGLTSENWTIFNPEPGIYSFFVVGVSITGNYEGFILSVSSTRYLTKFKTLEVAMNPNETSIDDSQVAVYPIQIHNPNNVAVVYTLTARDLVYFSGSFSCNGLPITGENLLLPQETTTVLFSLDPISLGKDNFTVIVGMENGEAVALQSNSSVFDDDTTPPVVSISIDSETFDPTGGADITFTINAVDPESGIDTSNVYILVGNAVFTSLGTHVVNIPAIGTYPIVFCIPNADLDRGKVDQEWYNVSTAITIDLKAFVDVLNNTITASPSGAWSNPNKKGAMLEKINELAVLINAGNYSLAYEKLLTDIKPKLTGLMTDENETPWGNGVFKNPWVKDALLQARFLCGCNIILHELKQLE